VAFVGLFRLVGGDGTEPNRSFDIRFAFPAEMWTVLEKVSANPIKDFHRRVLVHWSARELITLIGNRLNIYCHLYAPDLLASQPVVVSTSPSDPRPATLGYDEARRLIDAVDRFAPGFAASVLETYVQTPLALERELSLPRGNVMHVEMGLASMFGFRPTPALSGYRVPGLAGLYLAGASTHPGGGVSGNSGRTAARVLLADRRPLRRVLARSRRFP
jgi:hypothetical protein